MYTHTLLALLCAALAGGSAWQVQSWRFDAERAKYENKTLAQQAQAQDLSRAVLLRQADSFKAATNAAMARAAALRRDADSARTALDGLRRATADAPPGASNAADASTDRAAAIGELLNACAERYQDVAAKADLHANDVKTLTDAWPKE